MRVRPSAALRNRIAEFYGIACVLCDKYRAELHHNDEDSGRTVFENLIPLCASCNRLIAQQQVGPLRDTVSTPSIKAKSFQHYCAGNFRQAYAANRVGGHLCETREHDNESAIAFLIESLSALRQIGELGLVRDVVFEIERLFAKLARVQPSLRADFLARLGCVLYDFGNSEQAEPFVLEALKGYRFGSPYLNSAQRELAKSRARKHIGMVLTARARDGKSTDYALQILKDAEATARDYNHGQAISSALLVQAYQARRDLRWENVRGLAETGLQFQEQNDSLSNAMWYYLLGCFWEVKGARRSRAVDYYRQSYQRFEKGCLMRQPIATFDGMEIADPAHALTRLGVTCSPLPKQQQEAFSIRELKRLFQAGTPHHRS